MKGGTNEQFSSRSVDYRGRDIHLNRRGQLEGLYKSKQPAGRPSFDSEYLYFAQSGRNRMVLILFFVPLVNIVSTS